jgi:uncharacterized protein (TIGR02266 family)
MEDPVAERSLRCSPAGAEAMSRVDQRGRGSVGRSGTGAASAAERRRSPRANVTLRIEYATVDELFSEFTRDINEGGLFVETEKLQPPGTEVSLQFRLPGSEEVLTTLGRVVQVAQGKAGVPSGMGIEFDELTPDDRERIDRIVRTLRVERES